MIMCKRYVILFFVLFSVSCNALPGWPKDKGIRPFYTPGVAPPQAPNGKDDADGRVNFTRISKELFDAYLYQEGQDRKKIDKLLEKCKGSETYHLDRAYRYGMAKLRKPASLNKRLKIERAVWNISQEFANENTPEKWWPTFLWTGISTACFVIGAFAQTRYDTWGCFYDSMTGFISYFGSGQA